LSRADAVTRAPDCGRDQLEIAEVEVRRVQQKRQAERLVARILGHEQPRDEAVLDRVGKLFRQLGDVVVGHRRELLAHDGLRRLDCRAVHRRCGVCHFADAEHG
jgi:hypothetical protein